MALARGEQPTEADQGLHAHHSPSVARLQVQPARHGLQGRVLPGKRKPVEAQDDGDRCTKGQARVCR